MTPHRGARRGRGALAGLHGGPCHAHRRRRPRAAGGGGCGVCLCPTTERDLADGVGPARRLAEAGARLSLGTDSNAVIDVFEEARAVELDERLETGVRGGHSAGELLRAATADGCAAIGWPEAGRIEPQALADLVTVGARRGASRGDVRRSRPRVGRLRRDRGRRTRGDRRRAVRGARRRSRRPRRGIGAQRRDLQALEHELAGDREHRPAGHQRPLARRGTAGGRARRDARVRGRSRRRRGAARARPPTAASTPPGAA